MTGTEAGTGPQWLGTTTTTTRRTRREEEEEEEEGQHCLGLHCRNNLSHRPDLYHFRPDLYRCGLGLYRLLSGEPGP